MHPPPASPKPGQAAESNTEAPRPQPRGRIRVAIADNEPIVRHGLRQLLSHEADLEVVGEAADGRQVLQILRDHEPDILLLELHLPQMDGFAVLQEVRDRKLQTKALVLTSSDSRDDYRSEERRVGKECRL